MNKINVLKRKNYVTSNGKFSQEAAVLQKFCTSSKITPSYNGLYLPWTISLLY